METAGSREGTVTVRLVGRLLLLLGAATTAVALFAPWQGKDFLSEARFCRCASTSLHASPPVVVWFLLVAAGAVILATISGRRALPSLSYATFLVPIALVFTYLLAYASTGAGDPSIEIEVRWGGAALAGGVILLVGGFVLVALTGEPGERQAAPMPTRAAPSR